MKKVLYITVAATYIIICVAVVKLVRVHNVSEYTHPFSKLLVYQTFNLHFIIQNTWDVKSFSIYYIDIFYRFKLLNR